jgi:Transglutaminase-like superfamily
MKIKNITIIILILFVTKMYPQNYQPDWTKFPNLKKEIDLGNFAKADSIIDSLLEKDSLSNEEKYELSFQKDKMHRIRLDFSKTQDDIIAELKKYYPNIDEQMLDKWETDKSLEMKIIDGKKWFFKNAVPNLFRVNKEAKKKKEEIDGPPDDSFNKFVNNDITQIVQDSKKLNKRLVDPVKIELTYTLTVNKDAVPDGKIIRCWLPYPREGHSRQTNIKLLSVNSNEYIIADNKNPQRTLYMEKKAKKGEPTVFKMSLEYTAYGEWFDLDSTKVKTYDKNSELYKDFTAERPPHIVFTDRIKKLSQEIIGNEKNPYNKVKLIFKWISDNIPWASAREYSTINNISDYCLKNMHGDCGIKGLLFITLCRYNGIPAKWQSGWMMHPGNVNLHDWTEVYYQGIGWVPTDPYMGVRKSDNPKIQYFFTDGTDPYHLIINDDYARPLFPAKIYPRSETNDFQRGELEWKGGNLYFDKWTYNMQVKYENANIPK